MHKFLFRNRVNALIFVAIILIGVRLLVGGEGEKSALTQAATRIENKAEGTAPTVADGRASHLVGPTRADAPPPPPQAAPAPVEYVSDDALVDDAQGTDPEGNDPQGQSTAPLGSGSDADTGTDEAPPPPPPDSLAPGN